MRGRDARLNLYGAVSVLLVTAFFVGLGTAAGVEIETAEPSAAKIAATDDLLYESFEEDFPSDLWRVEHPSTAADVEWGRTDYRASEGRFSIYCAGMGGDAPGDGGPAPAATASWAIAGPYDLSETTTATLTFDLWLQTEQFRDVFMWLVSTDGESFSGSARSTDTNDWQTVTTDLDNWGAAGSVIGEDRVWIAFVYQSDHSNLFEGAYVDEVRLTVDTGDPAGSGYTYTSNSDFALGDMVGVESTSNRLELTDEWDTYPYVWIPNSTSGTVSKVGTDAGDELARYAVGPDSEANPGVAAVDLDGACWVGNKGLGTVVKIGLEENGGCIDRSGNGVIETSRDINGDGDISGNEVFDWGEDECVLVEVVLAKGSEGTYTPGEAHEAYEANNLQAVAVDAAGDVWAGVHDSRMLYLIDGDTGLIADQVDVDGEVSNPTSTVVDRNGTVWISSWPDPWILALEPETEETFRFDLSHGSSGLAMNEVNGLYITGFEHSAMSSFDTVDSTVIWDREAGWQARGVATTDDGRIWVAAGEGTLRVYNVVGRETNTVPMAGGSTGVAVDQDGKVWVVGSQTDFVYRVDSLFVDPVLEKEILGSGGHDATGDLTGIVVRNLTSKFGSWTVIYDSENPGTNWGRISWQAVEPDGTGVAVRVRSSDGQEIWSGWETATNDADLSITPSGRYLQIQASLQQTTGDELPRLEELTVLPAEDQTPPTSDFSWTPESPQAGEQIEFTDTSTGAPTSWSWDFGDTATSDLQNPTHTYSGEGSYEVTLIAANGVGSDSSSQTIEVGSGVVCAPVCEATVPMTGDVNEAVSFQATVNAPGCAGDITYAWTFGDGSGSAEQNPAHEYGSTGTLRWGLTATVDGESCGRSGDITIVGDGPTACTSTYWVPVASRSEGANGSVWRTDLGLLGRDLHGAAVELRLHTDGGAVSRVVTVASLAMVQLVDVVGWIEPGLEASGALEVCSDGQLAVTSRTYNLLAGDHDCFPGGSFGQFLAGESSDVGLSTGKLAWLSQLRESEAFRTNIGLVNTGTEPATVEIRLYDASGVELDVFDVELEPGEWFQENRPFFRAGRGDLDAASASVKVLTGVGVFAYGSVIDNLTNDATTVPMKR